MNRSHPAPIPARAGIGLRSPHHEEVLDTHPAIAWLEVHSENYFGEGSHAQQFLAQVRRHYPVSLHGVGLGLGSAERLDTDHLTELKQLIEFIEPGLVSEHLCWGAANSRHLNDLLPLPYTEEALELMVDRVSATQDFLGQEISIENISSYLTFAHSTIPEAQFLAALAVRSGCGILCDVNNIHVNAVNHGIDATEYLTALPADRITEIHLAGFTEKPGLDAPLLIDSHSRPVTPAVWDLYDVALRRFGAVPTLIEWDIDIPSLGTLVEEANKAEAIARNVCSHAA